MNRTVLQIVTALVSGSLFGLGLALSGMLNPTRVQSFLDVFGAWDPSLAFVLGGAVVVAFLGIQTMKRMSRPIFAKAFHLPDTRKIDTSLVVGSALFGLGWGLGGFCPGPAVASLSTAMPQVAFFVLAMLAGMTIHDRAWRATR